MPEIIAQREFLPAYMLFDTIFLLVYAALLLKKKNYMTTLVGFSAGILYMLVDYGIFHLVCHTRSISEGHSLFWVLLWMSMSYGFTNFTWIWLCLTKDRHLKEWTLLILLWWFCCPMLSQTFGGDAAPVLIQRTTGAYHGYMTLLVNSLLETNLGMPYVYVLYLLYSSRFTEQLKKCAPWRTLRAERGRVSDNFAARECA